MKFLLKRFEDGSQVILEVIEHYTYSFRTCTESLDLYDNLYLLHTKEDEKHYMKYGEETSIKEALLHIEKRYENVKSDNGFCNVMSYLSYIEKYKLKKSIKRVDDFILEFATEEGSCFLEKFKSFIYEEYVNSVFEIEEKYKAKLITFLTSPNHYCRIRTKYWMIKSGQVKEISIPFSKKGEYVSFDKRKDLRKRIQENQYNIVKEAVENLGEEFDSNVYSKCFKWCWRDDATQNIKQYLVDYYSTLCGNGTYFITKIPEIKIYRMKDNNNTNTFDFVSVKIPIAKLRKPEQIEIIKEKKDNFDKLVILLLKLNKTYKRYNIPVSCLEVSDIILRADSVLEYKFQLKKGLRKEEAE